MFGNICGCPTEDAPGIEWVVPELLLSAPQRPTQPSRESDPVSVSAVLRDARGETLTCPRATLQRGVLRQESECLLRAGV